MIGDGDVLRKIVVGANAFVSEVKINIIMEKSSTVGAIIFLELLPRVTGKAS